MSELYTQEGRPSPARGGGSVRRAREKMEAGLPPEVSSLPQQNFETAQSTPNPPQTRSQIPIPSSTTIARNGPGMVGVAISRPTPVPQWPLAGMIEDTEATKQYQPPPGRQMAPQRPPRPSHVPSMLDASKLQEHTPSFQYRPPPKAPEQGQWSGFAALEEDMSSPDITSPMTQSSRPSTVSSVGTIPDFPIPLIGPTRRSVHSGPPPSARRTGTSYYSQASYVSPIPEESPRMQPPYKGTGSHSSYASSAAIPSSWGSEYGDDEDVEIFGGEVIDERGESRSSTFDDGDDRGLIRSASIGKRAKPSMIITKSSESISPDATSKQKLQVPEAHEEANVWPLAGSVSGALPKSPNANKVRSTRDFNSPLAGGTGLIDGSISYSEQTFAMGPQVFPNDDQEASSVSSYRFDEKSNEMLGADIAAKSLRPSGVSPTMAPSTSAFSKLSAIRRPPRLDIDAIREAEARGSLTSLPDLIRRATRLAAMMDRGKRPGSRLNDLNDYPLDEKDFERTNMSSPEEKRHSNLSGMLAAFPPPAIGTPRDGPTPRPVSTWPAGYEETGSFDQSKENQKKKRRLPCWGISLIVLILLIIIAAAVVVPLELLVFNKPKSKNTSLSALQQCAVNTATACQNGGTSLIDAGACACVCINGFTGSTCSVSGATGCITTTLTGSSILNVTLGEAIPRLIAAAQTNFSIPLLGDTILARLNGANLSCTSENALVTFNDEAERQGNANDVVIATASAMPTANNRRDVQVTNGVSGNPVSGGIITNSASSTTLIISTTSTSSAMSTPSATDFSSFPSTTSSSTTAAPTASFLVTEEVLDFARVAVLFVLQQEALNSAVAAQSALQNFFTLSSFTNRAAANVSLGGQTTINLVGFSIDLGDGLVGKNSTMMKRYLHGRSIHF